MRKAHQFHPRPTALQAELSPATYGALVRFASKRLRPLLGKGAGLASAAPRSLPPPGAAGVPITRSLLDREPPTLLTIARRIYFYGCD